MRIFWGILIVLSIMLTGCGQSGALYMPSPSADKKHSHDEYIIKNKQTTPSQTDNTTQQKS